MHSGCGPIDDKILLPFAFSFPFSYRKQVDSSRRHRKPENRMLDGARIKAYVILIFKHLRSNFGTS